MKPIVYTCSLLLLMTAMPSICAAGMLRQYADELNETVTLVKTGALKQAVAKIEGANEGDDKDILYFFEKGELLSLGSNFASSRETWMKGDEIIQAWENEFRTNPTKMFGDIGSFLINDKTRRYDGQDYEKVLLSTRLTLNHIMLGNFDHARIEMKKTYEREKLIETFREKEYDALQAESNKQDSGQVSSLEGYPMQELDTPEVRELKNGFQNAFAHYLAGYFFEVTDEPSLAEPGYRNALQLAPGKVMIQSALNDIGKRVPGPGETDVLFVVETGFAPRIDSLTISIPIMRKGGMLITPLSFPVLKVSEQVSVPSSLAVAGGRYPVETLTNIDTMARRLLKDQMPGIILRTVIRAGLKSVVQEQANKAHWIAGMIANVVSVSTEQADDRNWRTLPERISIARAILPQGRQIIEFQTQGGHYRTEADVSGRFTIVPIRFTGNAVYVGQPNRAKDVAAGFLPASTISAGGIVPPAPDSSGSLVPSVAAVPAMADLGKRVQVGDTTYIGDFRFAQPSGQPSGKGVIEWQNGQRFEGQLENGVKQGYGVFIAPGSFRYEGNWEANKQNGKGKTIFDNGDVYEGEILNGEFHGQGSYTTKAGSRYEGSWKNGVKEGPGKITFPDGDSWEGIFSNNERTDQGKMTFLPKPEMGSRPQEELEPASADKK